MRTLIYTLIAVLALHSCLSDDKYSTSASHGLTSPIDTLQFDTVISGEASSTRSFWVYNKSGEDVRIVSTTIAGGSSSPFGVNVDGTYISGNSTQYFDVRTGDSMRIFAQVTPEYQNSDEPVALSDLLTLTTAGGASLSIVLHAESQDMLQVSGLTITADTTISSSRPLRVMDSVVVAEGATLTLAAGTRLYFHLGAGIEVRGTLVAQGTLDSPIRMVGDRLDYMFASQPYSRIPGQWGGIHFSSSSYGNVIDYCRIESGATGISADSSALDARTLTIENSVIHNMEGSCVSLRHVNAYIGNSQLTNAGINCLTLVGGHYTLVHNTIANFYSFSSTRGPALYFANNESGVKLPLTSAAFTNCIITGYSTDEIFASKDSTATFEYSFAYSLLNTVRDSTDTRITDCQWDVTGNAVVREDNFTPAFDLTTLTFSFALDSASLAIDNADYAVSAATYPTDITGRSRTSTGKSDMGCYQH